MSDCPATLIAMEAQIWTVIGLLTATLLGSLFYLGSRIDTLGARFDSRIDTLSTEVHGQGSGLNSRLDALSTEVRQQGSVLADRIYELTAKLDDHLKWHAG